MSSPVRLVPADPDIPARLEHLTLPQLQVVEALAALGTSVPLAGLTLLLVGHEHDDRVVEVLDRLCVAGFCALDGSNVVPVEGLRKALGRPLGLGPTLAEVLSVSYADDLRRMARHLGLPSLGRKEATLGPVAARLAAPGVIQAILAEAPDGVIDAMINLAWCEGEPMESAPYDDRDWEPEFRLQPHYRDDSPGPRRWGLGHDHAWARERGLVFSRREDGRPDLPAEVALVLRGPDYRAPFEPDRPLVPVGRAGKSVGTSTEPADAVTGQWWLRLTRLCAALLLETRRKPLPRRKSGELTAPELKRLASTLHATADEIEIVLALARSAALVVTDSSVIDATRSATWFDAEIPERAAILARQICALPRPLSTGDHSVSRSYSWSRPAPPADVTRLRQALLGVLAELPPGECTHLDTIRSVVRWDAPRTIGADSEALEALWLEAESTCLIVTGSLSAIGRALADPDRARLTATFASLMPAVIDEVAVGSDLTATVTGLPTRRLSQALDAVAEREREDTATVWRFTRSSVRQAFDDGSTQNGVLADLAGVSRTPLPASLTRLIADIASQHGHLVVRPAGAILTSEDASLLVQLQGEPGLGELELRSLAPGILVATVSHDRTLDVLRSGGYLPVSAATGRAPRET